MNSNEKNQKQNKKKIQKHIKNKATTHSIPTPKVKIKKEKKIPLVRNCWVSTIYKKNRIVLSSKQRFINFLTKQGKKSKAYKLLTKTGILIRKKIIHIEKNYKFFESYSEVFETFSNYPKKLKKSTTKINIKHPSKVIPSTRSEIKAPLSIDTINSLSFNQLLQQAIDNIKPCFEVRKVRVGGTTYLVPAILRKKRQETLAIKWLIDSARLRKSKASISFTESLSNELLDALKKQGQARQKRDELHKLAELNRAYTRYRWW